MYLRLILNRVYLTDVTFIITGNKGKRENKMSAVFYLCHVQNIFIKPGAV